MNPDMAQKPWDPPTLSRIPNRQGDRKKGPLYCALGQAISNWEGVAAAIGSVLFAMLDERARIEPFSLTEEDFGNTRKIHERMKQLKDRWIAFCKKNQHSDSTCLHPELRAI
jgi:hypothetical protein